MKRTQEKPIEPTLPITPMLDMTFQLFAFFVFTYHPTSLEGKLDFSLPAAGEYKADSPEKVKPTTSDTTVDLDSDLTVEIRTAKGENKGNISQIMVKSRGGDKSVPADERLESLRKFLEEALKNPDVVNKTDIKIAADSNLKYAYVIEVMDVCMKAGFKQVGFAPPPDLASAGN